MDIKSLSSCQFCWAQELSFFYFWINYCYGKANKVEDALFCFLQRGLNRKKSFKQKTLKSFIVYNAHKQISIF